ncbi:MAG: hypothetical protein ABL933_02500 [Methyloglobulus sp.]|nr:hypothetical protein [Methyloglobulus sp.]
MKKRKKMKPIDEMPKQNPVAKFAGQFNKAKVFEDKSKYNRKGKHKEEEASPLPQK